MHNRRQIQVVNSEESPRKTTETSYTNDPHDSAAADADAEAAKNIEIQGETAIVPLLHHDFCLYSHRRLTLPAYLILIHLLLSSIYCSLFASVICPPRSSGWFDGLMVLQPASYHHHNYRLFRATISPPPSLSPLQLPPLSCYH